MSFFSTEYHEAREKFLKAAEDYGLRNVRFRIPHEATSELFLDFSLVRRNPEKLVIHMSGTHGIEGYLGSAVQSAILSDPTPTSDASLLFVHAVNPYGMQFYRRANGENVDLNRNYEKEPKPNPDYACFNTYLNPSNKLEFLTGKLRGFYFLKKFGKARTSQAIASGQYIFPKGLFYMGDRVQREISLLQEILRSHFSEAKEVLAIDLHSGLGNWAQEMLFVDEDIDPSASALFAKIFGRAMTVPDPAQGSYINQGRLSGALRDALPGAHVHCVLQEIGTHESGKVLNALRRENFEWNSNGPVHGASPDTQKLMLEMFCPSDSAWRENALRLGRTRWHQAVSYFPRA
ncbi:MAG: DUF2817 domain-containing protein [Bdellovibrionota bacterium]